MSRPAPTRARRQRGATLIFALLTLVALLLSSLALVRNMDTGSQMMGNLGFKQDATVAADQATRQAIDWMTANKFELNTDNAAAGYFASNQEFAANGAALPPVDVTGRMLEGISNRRLIDWNRDRCISHASDSFTDCTILPMDGTDVGGNQVRFVIFRLCNKAGDYIAEPSIECAKITGTGGSETVDHGDQNYVARPADMASATPYFRVIVRVAGARDTVSFTETLVHF